MDITDAVDAACQNVFRDNVMFVQGDIFESPIRRESVEFAYSIGVLHHTPNPQQAFELMVDLVKADGSIGVSLYEISLYHRPNRNTLGVVAMDALWALNMLRCELFRTITTRLPDKLMIVYCKTVIPVLHVINKVPVLRFARYLFPSTCYRNLPPICSMVDTMDTYSTKIVHQYRAKDVFQWARKVGLQEIVLMNSRPGWVSIVAEKGSSEERARRSLITRQPKPPGESGFLGSDCPGAAEG
jgi:SAM-dependent methyltransferase